MKRGQNRIFSAILRFSNQIVIEKYVYYDLRGFNRFFFINNNKSISQKPNILQFIFSLLLLFYDNKKLIFICIYIYSHIVYLSSLIFIMIFIMMKFSN